MRPSHDTATAMMMAAIQSGYIVPPAVYVAYEPTALIGRQIPLLVDNVGTHSPQHLQHIALPSFPHQSPPIIPFPHMSPLQLHTFFSPPSLAYINPALYLPVQYFQAPYALPSSSPPARIYQSASPPPPAPRQLKWPTQALPQCTNEARDVKRAKLESDMVMEEVASRTWIDPS